MYRQIITPHKRRLILNLPAKYVGKRVEVIAFTADDIGENENAAGEKTYSAAIAFFKKHAIDFSKITKWNREDLYE